MAAQQITYCGYADVLVHKNCKNLNDVRLYNNTIGNNYPNMRVNEDKWLRSRKRLESYVNDR